MNDSWEADIAALLSELADVQGSLLGLLGEKRAVLVKGDSEALSAMARREQEVVDRLQACHSQRQALLARAAAEGYPADSIGALSSAIAAEDADRLQQDVQQARRRCRLIQHQSLANWVLVQRSLLHLSQMLEIIATGGQSRPTYGNGSERQSSGSLVDRAA